MKNGSPETVVDIPAIACIRPSAGRYSTFQTFSEMEVA